LDGVPPGGISVSLVATVDECLALARRLDLIRLDHLEGEVRVERAGEDLVHLDGRVRAALAQPCVVTLDPVEARVDAPFERLFSRSLPVEEKGEVEVDPEALLPEPLPDGGLDLGEILAEELSLALYPYLRSPGAEASQVGLDEPSETHAKGAFAMLSTLKKH
jgi:uncharacterized metal-binding protein YceD (DUF177 family)